MTLSKPPDLSDGVVRLRPLQEADVEAVFVACQDPLIARFIPVPQPYTMDDARTFVSQRLDPDPPETTFAVVDAATGVFLGVISRHRPVRHRVSFGYWLAPGARRRGVATRALLLIVDWTLATTGAIRLELWTDVDNDASGAVALRAEFDREGIRRAWSLGRDGRPEDAVFYVRLRGDAP